MADEVRATLVVDDKSEATLKHAEENFKKVREQAEKGGHGMNAEHLGKAVEHGEFMAHMKERLLEGGVELAKEAGEKIKEIFTEAFEAANEAFADKRAIAGVLAMTDQTGAGFDVMMDKAGLFHSSLQEMGIQAGVSEKELIDAFSGITQRTGKSALEVEELTRQMAYAGKAVPGGIGALSAGFEAIEMGVIKAKNPIVQMIASTGELHGNARQVAQQMQKLSPEKQVELATRALGKMGEKMKDMPPTMEDLKNSFDVIQTQMKESFGMPMVQALVPALDELKGYLMEHKDELEMTRHEMGKEFANVISEESDEVKKLAQIWRESMAAGKKDTMTAGTFFKSEIESSVWLFNQAAEIITKAGAGLTMMFKDATSWLKKEAESGGMGGYIQEHTLAKQAENTVGSAQSKEVKAALDEKLNKLSLVAGERGDQEMLDKIAAMRNAADAQRNQGLEFEQNVMGANPDVIARQYNATIENHEEGQQKYMAHLLAGSDAAQDALLKSGAKLKDGYEGLIMAMKEAGDIEAAKAFEEKAKAAASAQGQKASHVVNISGGIQIHQDFRDQDPDRVIIAMKRDINRGAENRIAARTGLPFGP
jgi:hypothetical protein